MLNAAQIWMGNVLAEASTNDLIRRCGLRSYHCADNYAYFKLLMLGYNVIKCLREQVLNQDSIKIK